MDKPKIELRKIKHSRSLSEETAAYTAEIWVDGKAFCSVSNHGQGGCDMHAPIGNATGFQQRLADLEALVAATFPKTDVSALYKLPPGSKFFDASLECVCGSLLADNEFAQMLRRDFKRKVLFLRGDDLMQMPVKKPLTVDGMIAHLAKREPTARILNTMPFDEALRLYSEAG